MVLSLIAAPAVEIETPALEITAPVVEVETPVVEIETPAVEVATAIEVSTPIVEAEVAVEAPVLLSKESTLDRHADYKIIFSEIDSDGSGSIDAAELKVAYRKLGSKAPSTKEILETIAEIDDDGDGEVNFAEFCVMMDKAPANTDCGI